jgi:uncharacterized phage protein (TIGR01671 family)
MREIKFRAWNKDDSNPMFDPFISGLRFTTFVNAPSIVLMQFTGLKDKNGKEIYEGDIAFVKDYFSDLCENWTDLEWIDLEGEIKFISGAFWICGKVDEEIPLFVFDKDLDTTDHIEIIGNIYENSELI